MDRATCKPKEAPWAIPVIPAIATHVSLFIKRSLRLQAEAKLIGRNRRGLRGVSVAPPDAGTITIEAGLAGAFASRIVAAVLLAILPDA